MTIADRGEGPSPAPGARWHRVCASELLPEAGLRSARVAGTAVLVARWQGRVHALGAECPHRGADLGEGFLHEGHAVCTLHLWEFDVGSGRCRTVPEAAVPVYEILERDGEVFVALPDATGE